jgi:hypothetical protein
MKDEDLDWLVYHLISGGQAATVPALLASTGQDEQAILESLRRLESGFLIDASGETVRALSLQECLLMSQCKFDRSLPFTVKNGVVRMKKQE